MVVEIVRADLLDDDDQVEYAILQSYFRETSGFKYAHRIEYVDIDQVTLWK